MTPTQQEALEKLKRYCAYQERCHQEVRTKLLSLKIYGDWLEEIIVQLVEENYLNEERYARSYARGKHNIKLWGKTKIKTELKRRKISDYCIRKAMEEIDEEEYEKNLNRVIDKYILARQGKYNSAELHKKALHHAVTKGYEYTLANEYIQQYRARDWHLF